ncbi:MAG: ankyrin repeat domain-containing protein [Phycisphaerales bacterium]
MCSTWITKEVRNISIAIILGIFLSSSFVFGENVVSEENNMHAYLPDCEVIKCLRKGNLTELEELLKTGANINCQDKYGSTALMIAAEDYAEAVPLLIKYGADLNIVDHQGFTALMEAAKETDLTSLKYLIEAGADLEKKDFDMQQTVLIRTCWFNGEKPKSVIALLLKSGANVNAKDGYGETALMHNLALTDGNSLGLLMEHGADLNIADDYSRNALTIAASECSVNTIKKLIGYKPDLNHKDKDGRNAIFFATGNKNIEAIDVFVKAGVDISAIDNKGWNALLYAALGQKLDAVKKLVELGLDINSTDKSGRTFFNLMAERGLDYKWPAKSYIDMVDGFMKLGADINKSDQNGVTPLMYAAAYGNYRAFEVLINAGADGSSKDTSGKTFKDHIGVLCSDKERADVIIEIAKEKNLINVDDIAAIEGRMSKEGQTNITSNNDFNLPPEAFTVDANAATFPHTIMNADGNEIITVPGYAVNINGHDVNFPQLRMPLKLMNDPNYLANIKIRVDGNEVNYVDLAKIFGFNADGNAISGEYREADFDVNMYGSLAEACKYCDEHAITKILETKPDVNVKDSNGVTPLMIAASNCSAEIVKKLINAGANIKAVNKFNGNVLMYACRNKDANVAGMLMDNFDVNAKTVDGWTALLCAAEDGNTLTVKRLLGAGADAKAIAADAKDGLMCAIEHDNIEVMKIFINAGADLVSSRSPSYKTPLIRAFLYCQNKETIIFLVEQIAKKEKIGKYVFDALDYVSINSDFYLMTKEKLQYLKDLAAETDPNLYKQFKTNYLAEKASYVDDERIIYELIEDGADPNGRDKLGRTVLMNAATNQNPVILEVILEHKVDIDAVSGEGKFTALHYAIKSGHIENAEILIKAGANISNKEVYGNLVRAAGANENPEMLAFLKKYNLYSDTDREVLLMAAVGESNLELAQSLIAEGVSKEVLSKALFKAANNSSHKIVQGKDLKYEMIKELVKAGADINAQDESMKQTALVRICYDPYTTPADVQFMIEHGADVNIISRGRGTALLAAVSEGNLEIIGMLIKAGADLQVTTNTGKTPLSEAIEYDRLDILDLLLASMPKIDEKQHYDLLEKVLKNYRGDKETVLKKLLDAKININAIDSWNRTILMELCQGSNVDAIRMVLKNGGDPTLQDKFGHDSYYFIGRNTKLKDSKVLPVRSQGE